MMFKGNRGVVYIYGEVMVVGAKAAVGSSSRVARENRENQTEWYRVEIRSERERER
jgi:hypothetical protein